MGLVLLYIRPVVIMWAHVKHLICIHILIDPERSTWPQNLINLLCNLSKPSQFKITLLISDFFVLFFWMLIPTFTTRIWRVVAKIMEYFVVLISFGIIIFRIMFSYAPFLLSYAVNSKFFIQKIFPPKFYCNTNMRHAQTNIIRHL